MPNYREQTGVGTSWVRAYRATCSNNTTHRAVWFDEEIVFVGPDGVRTTTTAMGMGCGLELTAQNSDTNFPLLDESGDPTGQSVTYRDAYILLMSLYYSVATARDLPAAVSNE